MVLCRATDSYTVDFQSTIDFLSYLGQKIIRVEDGAAAVDAVISVESRTMTGTPAPW